MKDINLWFIVKEGEVLLAMKKRGFWEWKRNGYGWKLEEWETVKEAFIREMKEEIWVKAEENEVEFVWITNFFYTDKSLKCHIFTLIDRNFKPIESEEMFPKWFKFEDIPYDMMWVDDKIWLPVLLSWEKNFEYEFYFDDDYNILKWERIK